ncbi:phage/plasmid primase, P4 family [Phyllobacterium chamaecytisi]|uniref:phage/plasmid primase, P4 family n=1 Tax=Phyllobacterium chamaecytisi TaxID=2876082 RepID=UPI001CCBFE58|nr:phage/plasmid primase, P4 family [Phyllobacterium sp. KW56]MBZ9604258.1 phage/plasmid primase, P4 family [Phyllobacterium sp. KW56]
MTMFVAFPWRSVICGCCGESFNARRIGMRVTRSMIPLDVPMPLAGLLPLPIPAYAEGSSLTIEQHAEKYLIPTLKELGLSLEDKRDADDAMREDGEEVTRRQIEAAMDRMRAQAKIPVDLDLLMKDATIAGIINEIDTADTFVSLAEQRVRFDQSARSWFVWNGTFWRKDETRLVYEAFKRLAQNITSGEDKARIIRDIRRAGFASNVETLARTDKRISCTAANWDRDPDLLGTPGGTVNLRTGRIFTPRPTDLISKQTAVAPDRRPPNQWLDFLIEATGGDAGMITFLKRWFGYSLTGCTSEEALVFIFGPGGNGKGVLLSTIVSLAGDYARTAPMAVFTSSDFERHSTDLAMLAGARLVTAQETKAGHKWDEERIKVLTGRDAVTARFMYKDNFTFQPQFTLTMSGNHAPSLENVDEAIRRRVNIIPFIHKPAKVDPDLKDRLIEQEGPQILGWLIDGAREWYAHGLTRPASVIAATESYFAEQDTLGQFIIEMCEVGSTERDTLVNLHKAYMEWSGDRKITGRALAGKLQKDPRFAKYKDRYGVYFTGLKFYLTQAV